MKKNYNHAKSAFETGSPPKANASTVEQDPKFAMSVKNRYKIVDGSQSCHCCFEKTIIDTENPVIIIGNHRGYAIVCECLDSGYAELICEALNHDDSGFSR